MSETIKLVFAFAFIGMLLFVLGAIIRFSIISSIKTKAASQRLRRPNLGGLEALSGFRPPNELVAFYKEAPMVEQYEFTLVDEDRVPPRTWEIGGFIPINLVDAREWRKVSGVPGIPIATDPEKGVYWIDRLGTVRFKSPNVEGGEAVVASNITEFASFKVKPGSADDR